MARTVLVAAALLVVFAAVAIAAGLETKAAASGAAAPAEPFRFGAYRATIGPLADPAAVAIAPGGAIFVAEAGLSRVSVFGAAGAPVRILGGPGPGEGRFLAPGGLALAAADGTLYVADTGNHRVQAFAPDGTFLRAWGGYGDGAGEFNEPRGIAVNDGQVYVVDQGNHRIQVFRQGGEHELTLGGFGHGDGAFNRPVDVAVDPDGFIYVTDADNNRIQKFDREGGFVASWGDWGPFVGLLDQPGGIVLIGDALWVADESNHRLQRFSGDGAPLDQWGTHALLPHEGEGLLHYPHALAVDPAGGFGVIVETFENRCQIFDAVPPGAEPAGPPPVPRSRKTASHFGERIAIDGKLLTIAEPEKHRTYLFELSRDIPIIIGDFGERGTRFGQMIRPAGLALDTAGRRIFMSDLSTRRIQEFSIDYDPEGPRGYSGRRVRFTRSFDLTYLSAHLDLPAARWIIEPTALKRDGQGKFYVVDPRNCLVLVFDPAFRLLRTWGGHGTGEGRLRSPTDLALGSDGSTIFVVDSGNHRVQAFDHEGRFRRAWDSAGPDAERLEQAFGITAGRDGFVYVTDSSLNRVIKYTEDGDYVTHWGTLGVEHGEFWKPKGVAQDDRERLYVVDYGNHRAQIFSPEGEWLVTFGTGRAFTKWDARPAPGR